ncbi:hypothetical protein TRVL_02592 [Trypanosoma vivax]|uniref:Uncharacterized protein n=1 Tax=Trypanosoma vivax (strain Y486) TaxID=1055687 RepID=G0U9N4_TRYVY|nr:hypothetical protein TRVL_02592 [Trypanosoma vivax]CCC54320.1 hypothetical protein TVY486_1118040 [Trypanosoma vivax Y486]
MLLFKKNFSTDRAVISTLPQCALSSIVLILVSYFVYISFYTTSFSIVNQNLGGLWIPPHHRSDVWINIECTPGDEVRCDVVVGMEGVRTDSFSALFYMVGDHGWIASRELTNERWMLLRYHQRRLFARVLGKNELKLFVLSRHVAAREPLIRGKLVPICSTIFVIAVSKWAQIKWFSKQSPTGRARLFRYSASRHVSLGSKLA